MASPTFGVEDGGIISIACWLIVKRGPKKWGTMRGGPSVRVKAGEPDLAKDERAIKLGINLPAAIFELPSLSATINIEKPSEAVSIDIAGVAEAVKQAIGMDVEMRVVPFEEESDG
jgi:hypothetical protein